MWIREYHVSVVCKVISVLSIEYSGQQWIFANGNMYIYMYNCTIHMYNLLGLRFGVAIGLQN